MTNIVLDASVIAGFLLKSQEAAIKKLPILLRGTKTNKYRLLTTSFLPQEVMNSLRFSSKDKHKSLLLLNHYYKLPIEHYIPDLAEATNALKIAYECDTTVYDASYHALAISRNSILYTCDKKYFNKTKHLGHIKLLS